MPVNGVFVETVRAQENGLPRLSFNRDILPILSNNCFACHGPDEKKRETKFHFDTPVGAFLKKGVIERGNAAGKPYVAIDTVDFADGSSWSNPVATPVHSRRQATRFP